MQYNLSSPSSTSNWTHLQPSLSAICNLFLLLYLLTCVVLSWSVFSASSYGIYIQIEHNHFFFFSLFGLDTFAAILVRPSQPFCPQVFVLTNALLASSPFFHSNHERQIHNSLFFLHFIFSHSFQSFATFPSSFYILTNALLAYSPFLIIIT